MFKKIITSVREFWKAIILALLIGIVIGAVLGFFLLNNTPSLSSTTEPHPFSFRSIDTMKYSRDQAREMLENKDFDNVIDRQMADIAETGATHVAIATPYDAEFLPFLKRWVASARDHGLKVWFRGNFSGWEGWFDYESIDRNEHMSQLREFIEKNPSLFEDGDVFSACPECENGGPGDPRFNGDTSGHRQFLIDEYRIAQDAFRKIGKDVDPSFHSMNADVARLIMNAETTEALNNTIVIDHYVETPEELAEDALYFGNNGKYRVILGEFGAPIPDLHGAMSQAEQALWLENALSLLKNSGIYGLNYWTNVGGTTALWDTEGNAREAVSTLREAYKN